MKNVLKRMVPVILIACMVVSLVACGGNSTAGDVKTSETPATTSAAAEKEPVTINFPTSWVGAHPFAPYLTSELERFNQMYGNEIIVKIEEMPDDVAMDEKIKVLIAANDFPDVCVTNSGALVDLAEKAGLTVDFKPVINADADWLAAMNTKALDYWAGASGKWTAISSHKDALGYFYNKELYAQAGIQAPAKTWDEFFKNCDALKAKGITPLAMGTNQQGWTVNLWFVALIGTSNDAGNLFTNTKTPASYETPEVIAAAANLKKMLTEYTTKDAVGLDYSGTMNNFYAGKAAMVANGIWINGDMADEKKAPKDFKAKVGLAMFPNDGMFGWPGYVTLASAKNKDKIDAETKFVKFLNDKDGQTVKLQKLSLIPDCNSLDVSSFELDPLLKDIINNNKVAKYTFLGPWSIYQQGIQSNISQYLASLAMTDTPEQFCKTLTTAAK